MLNLILPKLNWKSQSIQQTFVDTLYISNNHAPETWAFKQSDRKRVETSKLCLQTYPTYSQSVMSEKDNNCFHVTRTTDRKQIIETDQQITKQATLNNTRRADKVDILVVQSKMKDERCRVGLQ